MRDLPSCDEIDADGVNIGSVGSGQIRAVGRFQFHFVFQSPGSDLLLSKLN